MAHPQDKSKQHIEHIEKFLSQHLGGFELNWESPGLMSVEKIQERYCLHVNPQRLSELQLSDKELECLLYHEKAHYALGHLEKEEVLTIHFLLVLLLMVLGVTALCLPIHWGVGAGVWAVIALLVTGIHSDLAQKRKFEFEADEYAWRQCHWEDYETMLCKLNQLHTSKKSQTSEKNKKCDKDKKEKKYNILKNFLKNCEPIEWLSTHPSIRRRLHALRHAHAR